MDKALAATFQLLDDIVNKRSFQLSGQQLLDEFNFLDFQTRREYLEVIKEIFGDNVQTYMMLLSFLLEKEDKQEVIDAIDTCMEENAFDYIEYLS